MNEVEEFINGFDGAQKAVMTYLHHMVLDQPGVTSKISYGVPFYYRKSWVCYLNPLKNGKVEFAFPRGNELSNEQGLLRSEGRKQVRGVEFAFLTEIPEDVVMEILQEALILDEEVKYKSKRGRSKY